MKKSNQNENNELKNIHEDKISLNELMSVEGGSDQDSDDDCLWGTCKSGAVTNYCESNV